MATITFPHTGPWEVQIKGEPCSPSFEISVIRQNNRHGHASWGWFDANKLLICHNGGPCNWPLIPIVWDRMVKLAHEVAAELNLQGSTADLGNAAHCPNRSIGDIAQSSPNGEGYYEQDGYRFKTLGLSSSIQVGETGNPIGQAFSHDPTDEVIPE